MWFIVPEAYMGEVWSKGWWVWGLKMKGLVSVSWSLGDCPGKTILVWNQFSQEKAVMKV